MPYTRLSVIHECPDWVMWRGEHPASRSRCTVKEAVPGPGRERVASRLVDEYTFVHQFFEDKHRPRYLAQPVQPDGPNARVVYEDTQGTLRRLVSQEGTLAVDLVANVLTQVAEALKDLHARKLGHGGLHDHTVLVAPDGTVRLAPFVGYKFDPNARPPAPDKEARYQAPELLTGTLDACNPTSDLYCLGFLALEMLAGVGFNELLGYTSSASPKPAELIGWHANPRKKLPPLGPALRGATGALVEILEALTRKDQGARGYRTAADLLQALYDFKLTSNRGLPPLRADGLPPPLPPPPDPGRSREKVIMVAPPGASGTLVLTRGGDRHEFRGPVPVLAGSADGCQLFVPDPDVEHRHALITRLKDGWWVYDLRTSAGTHVNGHRVRMHPLTDGDELRLGGHSFQVAGAVKAGRKLGTGKGPGEGTKIATAGGRLVFGVVLHAGRQGTIYRAMWEGKATGKRRPVAVRVFPPEFARNAPDLERFLRGAPLAGQVKHPNVVRLLAGGRAKDGDARWWFLAMEYLAGGSLRDVLARDGRLPPDRVIRCGRDIAIALGAAAERNLIHRNINPACILFDGDGTAKLGDFALLRTEDLDTMHNITRAGALPGEHIYQAPEVVSGRKVTAAADVYGLGASLYEAVTGRPPFSRSHDLPDLVGRIVNEPILPAAEVAAGVPDSLSRVLAKATDKDPVKRYSTAAEFVAALDNC